jgi:hypothetical protein
LVVELEHLKIETRLINEKFANVTLKVPDFLARGIAVNF